MKEQIACNEYESLTRRGFLSTSAGVAAAGLMPSWIPRIKIRPFFSSNRDVIVTVFMRGGADGLTLCAPHGDADYYRLRPTIAVPTPTSGSANKAKDLDGFFGLPPAMVPLYTAYTNGHLAFVHATGSKDTTRSHFDAMNFMEIGKPRDPSIMNGWLGRHLASSLPMNPEAPLRAVSMSYGVARTMSGGPKTLPIHDLREFKLPGSGEEQLRNRRYLDEIYGMFQDPLKSATQLTMKTVDLLSAIDFDNYQPAGGAVYPNVDFSMALKSSAALIKADVGVEAIHLDIHNWDTHNAQAPFDGHLFDRMKTLADGLAAFYKDMFAAGAPNLTVVVMSEFGRNVAENASKGTDHGHGNCMLVLGGKINGGQVIRDWPGLKEEQQFEQQDLAITIDYRDVLAEIITKRLGNADHLGTIFPDFTPTFRGVAQL